MIAVREKRVRDDWAKRKAKKIALREQQKDIMKTADFLRDRSPRGRGKSPPNAAPKNAVRGALQNNNGHVPASSSTSSPTEDNRSDSKMSTFMNWLGGRDKKQNHMNIPQTPASEEK